jgi:mannitol-1-phosphate 5-dehydrogenase
MQQGAIIFGAGRTGRGLAAGLCAQSGIPFCLVDCDPFVIDALTRAGEYTLTVLGSEARRLHPEFAATLASPKWYDAFNHASVCFTAIVGTNFPSLARPLAQAMVARHAAGVTAPLNLITCENLTNAAKSLRDVVARELPPDIREAILARTGFSEGMVLTTCLGPADPQRDPLEIRAQNAFRLPCDRDAFVGPVPPVLGLEPLTSFSNQLARKIFTYNGINAVISYLGAEFGFTELGPAARDPRIAPLAIQAGDEAGAGLIAAYGFDPAEQDRWRDAAIAKFQDLSIPDPISRNAADPARKLARDDRLVGPALLALKAGREPLALARGIVSAAHFCDAGKPSLLVLHGSLQRLLTAVCALDRDEPLFKLVMRVAAATGNGS